MEMMSQIGDFGEFGIGKDSQKAGNIRVLVRNEECRNEFEILEEMQLSRRAQSRGSHADPKSCTRTLYIPRIAEFEQRLT